MLELPTDHPRPAVQSYRGARLELRIDRGAGQRPQALAQREGVTLFMMLLASFQTLLHRYSGQNGHPRRRADRQPQPRAKPSG